MPALTEQPAPEGGLRAHRRPGHHHRRADPLRRDLLLPLQPPGPGGVHPVPQGPGLCGPGQGGAGAWSRPGRAGRASRESQRRAEAVSRPSAGIPTRAGGSPGCGIGSIIYANKPGDGSAREQAASCQRVLGGWANIAKEYATKRYRSNVHQLGHAALPSQGGAHRL